MLCLASTLCSFAPSKSAAQAKPVVHVFLTVDAKSSAIERALQTQCPDLALTVFGRFRDFEQAGNAAKPDAILGIPPVIEARGQKPLLQGQRSGKSTEVYVLASVGQALEEPLSGKTIGVVDLLGRENTQALVAALVKANDIKLKRVAKVEDLLPLLEFSAADGILVSSAMLARMAERTRLPLRTRALPGAEVGLPAVAVLNASVRETVIRAFQKLDSATKALLGIDAWSSR